jgi:hypothetical protein
MPFWRELKQGADRFEITKQEPRVGVCNGHYAFDRVTRTGEAAGCGTEADPELAKKVEAMEREDNAKVAELVAKGTAPIKLAYDDGGQNPSFRFKTIETSRPEAIAEGPLVELFDSKGALTKVAVRARGFDEDSIAAAVKDVGSPSTASTMVASAAPAQAKPAPATVASVSGSGAASAASNGSAATAVTVIVANASPQSNATAVARRDAPPSTGAHTTLAAFASPATEGTAGQDQPFYERLLAKLPFGGSDEALQGGGADAYPQAALDPQAPLPPVRPATLSRNTSPRPASPQAGLAPGLDLFSSHAIFAALPRFLKGSPASSPTTATGFAPGEP